MKRLIAILILTGAAAFAQTDSGSIRILVSDSSNANVADAQVKLGNVNTGIVTVRETASDGYATFSPIVRGAYSVEVSRAGFQTTRITDLTLEVDDAQARARHVTGGIGQRDRGSIGQR